jgi:type IX secretion system PorP/SprF family membrane protein
MKPKKPYFWSNKVRSLIRKRMNKYPGQLIVRFKKWTILGAMVVLCNASYGQQPHVFNQFFMNPYIYNPAYAGVDGHPVVFLMYKRQWANIPDGPQLMHATYHVPLKGGIGVGGTVYKDQEGPINTTAAKVSGSYLVNIDREHFIRFGMSLGAGSRMIDATGIDIGDPAFAGVGQSSMYMIGDFGATYHFGHFNAGFSMPMLFTSELIVEEGLAPIKITPTDNLMFKMNYRGHLSREVTVEPHILYRYSKHLPNQYEVAVITHLMHLFWVGGTYRQDVGAIALVGAKVKRKFAVGAAYEIGNKDLSGQLGPTYEIHVGLHLGKHDPSHKHKHVDHHHSVFNTETHKFGEKDPKKPPVVVQRDTKNDDDTLTGLPKNEPKEEPDWSHKSSDKVLITNESGERVPAERLSRLNNAGQRQVILSTPPADDGKGGTWEIGSGDQHLMERDGPNGTKEVGVVWTKTNDNGTTTTVTKWEPILTTAEAEAKMKEPVKPKDPVIVKTDTKVDPKTDPQVDPKIDPVTPGTGGHVQAKRGTHPMELPAGIYIIAGVFNSFANAEKLSERFFQMGFHDTKVGYVTARGHFYVAVRSYPSVERAQADLANMKRATGEQAAWVLQVND